MVRTKGRLIAGCFLFASLAVSGCGPAIPQEELGEILSEFPSELQFEQPYPVPWAKQSLPDHSDVEHDHQEEAKVHPAGETSGEEPATPRENAAEPSQNG
jgi:hypothetical protein